MKHLYNGNYCYCCRVFLNESFFKDWADTIITTQNCKAKNEDHNIDNID